MDDPQAFLEVAGVSAPAAGAMPLGARSKWPQRIEIHLRQRPESNVNVVIQNPPSQFKLRRGRYNRSLDASPNKIPSSSPITFVYL